ncbi:beta-lactamase [Virgibacillus soli]|nr:beta-lactamase [Virgibacillus soli]
MKLRSLTFSTLPMLLLLCLVIAGCAEDSKDSAQPKHQDADFAKLEEEFDARLGVFALDTGTGETISYRADERFAYASTHKALAVGALLQQISIEDLNQKVIFAEGDLVNYSPITEKYVDKGMTLSELSEASLRYSDNTAGNLILKELGGPDEFKKALKKIGDDITKSERFEPSLNEVKPGETHDTSTPKALATSLKAFTLEDELQKEKRLMLVDWMKRSTTGDTLIRAGVPKDWEVADKSGAALYGTRNDIAIIWPPNENPIILAILSDRATEDADYDDKLIEQAAETVIAGLKDSAQE